jgi:hypothetical protein
VGGVNAPIVNSFEHGGDEPSSPRFVHAGNGGSFG